MTSFFLSVALMLPTLLLPTLSQAGQPATDKGIEKMPVQKIEGEWTAVYMELDGKKIESKKL